MNTLKIPARKKCTSQKSTHLKNPVEKGIFWSMAAGRELV